MAVERYGGRAVRNAALAVLFLTALPAYRLTGQCPDGSPPPCAGQRVTLDANRIVILPFRVTSADTLLGQGMAELLAPEFTGENGPLAVNMPTVLRTWRRAGGGVRSPLDPSQAQRVAREMGAGRLVDGSIVGLGSRITVSATVTELPAESVRRVGPLSGPADSLEQLVGRLASALLGETGAVPVNLQIRLTDSPAAMRAYLEAMARYRFGDFNEAAATFERAFALDTLFARAALMRMITGAWTTVVAGWDSVAWKVRDRLSAQDRILLTALSGDHFPAVRSPEQNLADRRRAAALLPQSAEAQFWLGDYLFHSGSASGVADDFASARAQLELAYRLDPQFEEVFHLIDIGFYTGDTALVRAMWTAWQRFSPDSTSASALSFVVAHVLRDTTVSGRYARHDPIGYWSIHWSTLAQLPADEVAQIFGLHPGAAETVPTVGAYTLPLLGLNTGRMAWLRNARARGNGEWKVLAATLDLAGDSVIAEVLARSTEGVPWDSTGPPHRASAVAVIEALRSHAPDLREKTSRLDSLARLGVANFALEDRANVYGLLLGAAWEALGEPQRALAAELFEPMSTLPLAARLRQEGRLAAMVGDTARAIRAYRRYLSLRRDADPVLIPERDSVQAALARLERR